MRYRAHYAGTPGVLPAFGIVVDDQSMTWVSDPSGYNIPEPMINLRTIGEGLAPGKYFDIFPDGTARISSR
jgi:hypothetical protein